MDIHQSALLERLPEKLREATTAWLSRKRATTIRSYVRHIGAWLDFVEEYELDLLGVSRPDADTYCAHLEAQFKVATVAVRISTLSSWYNYLEGSIEALRNPFRNVERPTVPRHQSQTAYLSLDQAGLLLKAADSADGPQHLRDAALIRTMLLLGLRVNEAVELNTASLSTNGGMRTLKVVGKGGVQTERPLPDSVARAIDAYMDAFPHTGALFQTASGKALDPDYVSRLVTRFARHAGLPNPQNITAHSLRHTFATAADELDADPDDIRDAMGHADQRTTDGYLHRGTSLKKDPALLLEAALG